MRITELWTYPVKSCRGISHDAVALTPTGLADDRAWMIVDRTGMFVTQRGEPSLARLTCTLRDDVLVLAADGHGEITVPRGETSASRHVRVWRDVGDAVSAGAEVDAWLSSYLGAEHHLVRSSGPWKRDVVVEDVARPLSFTDGFPLLVISRASLDDLNARLPSPVPMARFRPSIVIDDVGAYVEDDVVTARRDAVVLRGARPCTRCVITTTDQASGARDPHSEPLRTLARYRTDRTLKGAIFGMNFALDHGVGETLRVGDRFSIQRRSA